MELNPYLDALREDLSAAAALGDDETRRAATLLTTALEPAARLALMSALSDFAAEVSRQLGDTTVDVSLRGRDVQVRVTEQNPADVGAAWDFGLAAMSGDAGEGETADLDDDAASELGRAVREAGDELSRTTLRLVNRLKAQAEHAANSQGVSLNTYIQRAVADAVRNAGRRARRAGAEWNHQRGPWQAGGHAGGGHQRPDR